MAGIWGWVRSLGAHAPSVTAKSGSEGGQLTDLRPVMSSSSSSPTWET